MDTIPMQCTHCRQRLRVKTNETRVICPGCKLDFNGPCTEPSYERSKSRNGNLLNIKLVINSFGKNKKKKPVQTDESLNINPSPMVILSSRPRMRAVLCGVRHKKSKDKVKECVNDVKYMRDLLIGSFGFQEKGMLILTEEEPYHEHIPTSKNMQKALKWLVEDCCPGDLLVFYFSGHALRPHDFNNDHDEEFDDITCPVLDKDINSILLCPIINGVTLHVIVGACDAALYNLDLLHKYNRDKRKWVDNISKPCMNRASNGGLTIYLGSCIHDDQVSSYTSALAGKTMKGGLMANFLTEAYKRYTGLTYGNLLDLFHEMKSGKQTAHLLSSEEFNVYKVQFISAPSINPSSGVH